MIAAKLIAIAVAWIFGLSAFLVFWRDAWDRLSPQEGEPDVPPEPDEHETAFDAIFEPLTYLEH